MCAVQIKHPRLCAWPHGPNLVGIALAAGGLVKIVCLVALNATRPVTDLQRFGRQAGRISVRLGGFPGR